MVPITPALQRYSLLPRRSPESAEWPVSSDMHAARYGQPTDRSGVYNGSGEPTLRFYQRVYAGEPCELVYHAQASGWTPEVKLWPGLMGSKWMVTSDARPFRRTP